MEKRDVEFVLKEDHLAALGNTSPTGNVTTYTTTNTDNRIDNSIDNSTHTVNINLMLPERTTKVPPRSL